MALLYYGNCLMSEYELALKYLTEEADKHGLFVECFRLFIADVNQGVDPWRAARDALYEWDI